MNQNPVFTGLNEEVVKQFSAIPTPCYVIDERKLEENCKIIKTVMEHTGCKVLLAQKAFSNFHFYPLLSEYLSGTEASGLFEARLGYEEMPGKEVHVFCAAYRDDEFEELLEYADHIVFNSINQLKKYGYKAKKQGKSIGIRVNPECSTQEGHEIYDPCARGSRLGVTREVWDNEMSDELLSLLDGIHFHTLCEQNADALEVTMKSVESLFGDILPQMKWINMGGGHHITRHDYDCGLLEKIILSVMNKWNVEVYLEPGEAVALHAGYMLSHILDIVQNNDINIAILDVSPACHMPDVIEMPYTPPIYNACDKKTNRYSYHLGGPTCLAGDMVGEYSFKNPLNEGDLLIFGDMAIYTTCKNNTFNGMPLPNIWKLGIEGKLQTITDFNYSDFKMRLGNIE